MEIINSIFLSPVVNFLFGGIGASLIVEAAKYTRQKRRRHWKSMLEKDIIDIKGLRAQSHIPSRKLQQEYFRYFNKYKEVLSSADVEMLMRQESASKGKQKELLSILLGLLEALQMK